MKTNELNKIQNTQNAEVEAKKAAEKAAAEKAILDAVQPGGVLEMIKDVEAGIASFVTDDNDNIVGFGYHAHANGMNSVKRVGSVLTVGATEEQRQQDELDAKIFTKRYGGMWEGKAILEIAIMLINAGLKPDEEIVDRGTRYFLLGDLKKVIDQRGNTIVDISEDPKYNGASKELILESLKDKLAVELESKAVAEAEIRSSESDEEDEDKARYDLYSVDEDGNEDYVDSYDSDDEACDAGWELEGDEGIVGFNVYDNVNEETIIEEEF